MVLPTDSVYVMVCMFGAYTPYCTGPYTLANTEGVHTTPHTLGTYYSPTTYQGWVVYRREYVSEYNSCGEHYDGTYYHSYSTTLRSTTLHSTHPQ